MLVRRHQLSLVLSLTLTLVAGALIFGGSSSIAAEMECDGEVYYVIDGDNLLNENPSLFASDEDLESGSQICVISVRERILTTWLEVRTEDGREGWVDDLYVGTQQEYIDSLPTPTLTPTNVPPTTTSTPTEVVPTPTPAVELMECPGDLLFVLDGMEGVAHDNPSLTIGESEVGALSSGSQVCLLSLFVLTAEGETVFMSSADLGSYAEYMASMATPTPLPTAEPTATSTATAEPTDTPVPTRVPTATSTPIVWMTVNVGEMLSAYDSNEIAAEDTYGGRNIEATGFVTDIESALLSDDFILTIGSGESFDFLSLRCRIDEDQRDEVVKLEKDGIVTVYGQMQTGGMSLGSVRMETCSLIPS